MAQPSRFDEAAADWDNNPTRVELARAVGQAITGRISLDPGWRVLDYGAGTGLLTLNLQPYAGALVALDSSQGMVDALTRKLVSSGVTNVQPRLWNLEAQPYPDRGFDLVVSSMTLHHLRDVPLVFRRLHALLKPKGRLAVADLDLEDGTFHSDSTGVFHQGFDRQGIQRWLEEAGFTDISVSDAHTIRKPGPNGKVNTYGVFLATAHRRG